MKSIIKVFFLLSILAACTPAEPLAIAVPTPTPSRTSIPSETPIPLDTPTFTSTIVPTFTVTPTSTTKPPLAEHEWNPQLVLFSIRQNFGDGGTAIGDAGSPSVILYTDGSLFVYDAYYGRVLTKKLNRKEICQNLNTLDQIGYLDYDPSNYSFIGGKPLGFGAPDTFITVNAWKAKSRVYYELSYFLQKNVVDEFYGQKGYPVISPALRNAYYFLNQYPNEGLEVYKPNRLAVWIIPAEYIFPDNYKSIAQTWQLKYPLFNDLLKRVDLNSQGLNYTIIMNSNEAKAVYSYLGEVETTQVFVVDTPDGNKKYYALFARPLLPYEILGNEDMNVSQIPAPGSPKPNFKLTCYPSDGVLPVPTPIP